MLLENPMIRSFRVVMPLFHMGFRTPPAVFQLLSTRRNKNHSRDWLNYETGYIRRCKRFHQL